MNDTPQQTRSYYFMAGLPRSGSTLLSSILNQNPLVHSGPSSPVVPTMLALERSFSNDELFMAYPKPNIARQIISSVLPQWYLDVDRPYIIDKNRSWTNNFKYIEGYFGIQPKIICPVRNIDEILTSFITQVRKNLLGSNSQVNFIDSMLIKNNIPLTDDNRCIFLSSPQGILGQSYAGIRDMFSAGLEKSLHLVEYNDIINTPQETMNKIYDFLEIPKFDHDFNNIVNSHREDDLRVYGITDMHEVRTSLAKVSVDPKEILSQEILNKCDGSEFWRNEINTNINGE